MSNNTVSHAAAAGATVSGASGDKNSCHLASSAVADRGPMPPVSRTAAAPASTSAAEPASTIHGFTPSGKPRLYQCTICLRSFARLEHLKRHEKSHTKEKPFHCGVCDRKFSRRDLLLRHAEKLHAGRPDAVQRLRRRRRKRGSQDIAEEEEEEKEQLKQPPVNGGADLAEKYQLSSSASVQFPTLALFKNTNINTNPKNNASSVAASSHNDGDTTITSPSSHSSSIKVNSLFTNFVSKPNFKRHQQKRLRRASFSASSGDNYAIPNIPSPHNDNNDNSNDLSPTVYYNSTNDLNFDFTNSAGIMPSFNNNGNTFTNVQPAEFSTPQFTPYMKNSYSFSAASSTNRDKNNFQLDPDFDIPVFSLNNNSENTVNDNNNTNTNNNNNNNNKNNNSKDSNSTTFSSGKNLASKYKDVVFADYDIYGTDNYDITNNTNDFTKKNSGSNIISSSGSNNWMMNDILDSSQLEFLANLQTKYGTSATSSRNGHNKKEQKKIENNNINNLIERDQSNSNSNSSHSKLNNDQNSNNDLFYGYGFYMDESSVSPIANNGNNDDTNNNHYVTLTGSNVHHRDSLNESSVSSVTMEKSSSGNNSGNSGVLDTISELNNFQNFQFLNSFDKKSNVVSQKSSNGFSGSTSLPFFNSNNDAGSAYTKSTNSTETMLTSSSNNSNSSNDNGYHNDMQPASTTVTTAATTKNNSNNSAEDNNNNGDKYFSHFNNISNGYGYYDNIINAATTPQENGSNNSAANNNYSTSVSPDRSKLFDSKMRHNVDSTLARYPFIGIEQPFVGTVDQLNAYIDSYYRYFNLVPHSFYPDVYDSEFDEHELNGANSKIVSPLIEAASVCLPLLMATMGAVSLRNNSKHLQNSDQNNNNSNVIGGNYIASNLYEASRRSIHVYLDLHKQWRTKCLKTASRKSKKTSQANKTPLWLLQALTLSVTYAIFGEFGHAQQIALKQAAALISLLKNMDFEDSFANFTTMQYLNLTNSSSPSATSSSNIEALKDLGHVNNSFLESCWESFEKLDILGSGTKKLLYSSKDLQAPRNASNNTSNDSGNLSNNDEVLKLRQKYLLGQCNLRTVYQICNLSFFLEYFYGIERKIPPINKNSKLPFPDFDDDFNKIANFENDPSVNNTNSKDNGHNSKSSMYLNIFEISLCYMPGIMEVFKNLISMNSSYFLENSANWKISELGLLALQNMFLSHMLNIDNFLNIDSKNQSNPGKPNNDILNNQNSLLWFGQCKLFNPTLKILLSQKQSTGSEKTEFGIGLKDCVLLQDYTYLRLAMFPSVKYQILRNEFFWNGNLKKIFKYFFSNEDLKFQDEISAVLYSLKLLTQVFFPEFHKSIFINNLNSSTSFKKQIVDEAQFMKNENANLFRMLNMLYQWNQSSSSSSNNITQPYLEFNPPERFSLYHQFLFDALLVLSGFCYRFETGYSKSDALYVKAYHSIKALTRVIESSYKTTLFPDISSYVTKTAFMVSTSSASGNNKSASIIDQYFCSLKFSYYSIGLCLIVLERCGFDVFNKVGVRTMRFINSEMVNYTLAVSNSSSMI